MRHTLFLLYPKVLITSEYSVSMRDWFQDSHGYQNPQTLKCPIECSRTMHNQPSVSADTQLWIKNNIFDSSWLNPRMSSQQYRGPIIYLSLKTHVDSRSSSPCCSRTSCSISISQRYPPYFPWFLREPNERINVIVRWGKQRNLNKEIFEDISLLLPFDICGKCIVMPR